MKKYKIGPLTLLKNDYTPEAEFRLELSKLLIDKFGDGPYSDHDKVREAIAFSYNYFCDKFMEICLAEKSVRFYQFVMSQHEQAIEVALKMNPKGFPEGIDQEYVAVYRRILKWILEQACEVELHNNEKYDPIFEKRAENLLNKLLFLGNMLFTCANIYAEQDMIEDVAEINFPDGQYQINHKHHYNYVIGAIQKSFGAVAQKHVADENPVEDLKTAIQKCFGLQYEYLTTVIYEIHKINTPKGGQYCGFVWESLPLSVESMFEGDPDVARVLFKGLTLDKNNKLPLSELICKPNTMFRYLYRPIQIWNIGGEDFAVVGKNGLTESIFQLTTNCIPWGKAPKEWMTNKCFRKYVHSKEDVHDKWLDDEVEKKLNSANLPYFRNITSITSESGAISLNQQSVGEIDFIIIDHSQGKIFVADCKHLQGRYDMMNQKNDFSNFTRGKKPYNQQIKNKISWLAANQNKLAYHYQNTFGPDKPDISKYSLEGIFIINTPTFYMFNSDYRIYQVDTFVELITGKLVDPTITVFVDEKDKVSQFEIDYPYFRIPSYTLVDYLMTESEEEE